MFEAPSAPEAHNSEIKKELVEPKSAAVVFEDSQTQGGNGSFVKSSVVPKDTCLAQQLLEKLQPKFDALAAEIKEAEVKGGKKFSSLVSAGFKAGINEYPGRLPRVTIESGSSVYVIVDQFENAKKTARTLEARLYAHMPAEINSVVMPWLKELEVPISQSQFIRPSAL